jgi:hypothetical protein
MMQTSWTVDLGVEVVGSRMRDDVASGVGSFWSQFTAVVDDPV